MTIQDWTMYITLGLCFIIFVVALILLASKGNKIKSLKESLNYKIEETNAARKSRDETLNDYVKVVKERDTLQFKLEEDEKFYKNELKDRIHKDDYANDINKLAEEITSLNDTIATKEAEIKELEDRIEALINPVEETKEE